MNKNTNKATGIYSAILNVREECSKPVIAEAINPMYTKKYATLQAIMEVLGPVLAKNNLLFLSRFERVDDVWGVMSELVWVGDEGKTEKVLAFFPGDRIADAQQMGKLYTYARRYNLTALLNLTFVEDQDDDDGNSLAPKRPATPKAAPKPLDFGNL